MKRLFLLLPILILMGCPLTGGAYKIYYHDSGATEGQAPVDNKEYHTGDWVTILDQGSLKNNDYEFLGWRTSNYYNYYYDYDPDYGYSLYYISPGTRINIGWDDINLYPVWDDGSNYPFSFIVEDGEVIITGAGKDGIYSYISLPDTIQGKPVTTINDTVFINSSIVEIRLPNRLKHIGAGAFAINEINRLTIPDSVESIGMGAFRENSLTNVVFGEGLTSLESHTFSGNKLLNIVIPENIKTIGAGAFMENDIIFIQIGSGVDIEDNTAMGTWGASFRTAYDGNGKNSGLYQYSKAEEIWK